MVPIIINHRSRNLSNDRHIQEAISNRHTSLSQGDIDTNNYFSSAFTCTGTGGWAPTVAAQRIKLRRRRPSCQHGTKATPACCASVQHLLASERRCRRPRQRRRKGEGRSMSPKRGMLCRGRSGEGEDESLILAASGDPKRQWRR